MTLEEITNALAQVNAAISQLIQGKQLTRIEISSGNLRRVYEYSEINISDLRAYRDELLALQATLLPTEVPTFRINASIPITVTKLGR